MKQYTTVYLMRHGQTTSNRLGAIMGQQDMPLSEHGIWQAGQAALALSRSDVSLAALYSSPLQRALHTSLIIAQAIGSQTAISEQLIEKTAGELEGLTMPDIYDRIGHEQTAAFNRLPVDVQMDAELAVGYETGAVAASRMDAFMRNAVSCYPRESILAVTHSGIIGNYLVAKGLISYDGLFGSAQVPNCNYTIVHLNAQAEVVGYVPYQADPAVI